MNPIVIIGTGLAGYTLARELRKLDQETPLTLITADDGRSYSKPMLSTALASGKDANSLAMADADAMALRLDATVTTYTRVAGIDTDARTLSAGGETTRYSALVMATGANPIVLPLQGKARSQILQVNNLQDYAVFRDRLQGCRRVTIIGAGLIGCEFANDLVGQGIEVDVIGMGATPLDTLISAPAGSDVERHLDAAGVRWYLQTTVTAVEQDGQNLRVILDQGKSIDTDLVLSAVGLRPDIELAREAGLRIDQGIITNDRLATSAEDVYAIGDCAEVNGVVRLFVMPIMHGARALAKTLCGSPTAAIYPVMPVVVKTPARPVVVSSGIGDWSCESSAEGVRCLQHQGKEMTGFCLTGERVSEKQTLTRSLSTHPDPASLP